MLKYLPVHTQWSTFLPLPGYKVTIVCPALVTHARVCLHFPLLHLPACRTCKHEISGLAVLACFAASRLAEFKALQLVLLIKQCMF